ncbi:MAG TPA: GyrI-like domain-containing protein [Chitinophagaceae bacterium]|nr:GyrI-like domain-containing protein [Chitinophagaceae bacterium]
MRFARLILFFILALIVVTASLSFLLPVSQKAERTVTIKAPAETIYRHLQLLENFLKFSVWTQQDSSAKYTMSGNDGTKGATCYWRGNPQISGEGNIEITALKENNSVQHAIHFTAPQKRDATSLFSLNEKNGITTVTWNFEMSTRRPWNIFNLFYSMDKEMGKDFEDGLASLKSTIEKTAGTSGSEGYDVLTMDFPATSFATIRQKVKWSDIRSFYSAHIPIIHKDAEKENASPGTSSVLFYSWDEKEQQTDMAAALPVNGGNRFGNRIIATTAIPASKAVYINYYGSPERTPDAFPALYAYLENKKLKHRFPIIQQYIIGPDSQKDTARWLTKIVFLVD